LGAHRKSHFHVPQTARGPKTVPQIGAWRCHSTPFGTAVQIGTLYWLPKEPPNCQNKYLGVSLV
jgi:hypothetical protein